jgi:hypothetical protein
MCIGSTSVPRVCSAYTFAVRILHTFARDGWFDALAALGDDDTSESGSNYTAGQTRDLESAGITVAPLSSISAQRPKRFADTREGRIADGDARAAAQLSNVLNISRVAHYVEALGRELGVHQGAESLHAALQGWLDDHVPGARVDLITGDYLRYELELRRVDGDTGGSVWVAGTLGVLP